MSKKKMFDFCIGNPPYNMEFGGSGDNKTYAAPVYDQFIDAAIKIADKVELIHPARFLFNVGSTPKAWNEKMLNDVHFKVLHYDVESKSVFPNTKIRGGICISYHDSDSMFGAIKVFTASPILNAVVKKINTKENLSLSSIMFIQNRFNLEMLYKDYPEYKLLIGSQGKDRRFETGIFEKLSVFTESKTYDDDLKVYGVIKKKRCYRYLPIKYADLVHENLCKYKVVLPKSCGEGVFGETLSSLDILEPQIAFTRSYISIGKFDTKKEAENCRKYIKTKFTRAMLDVKKATQDNPIDTWTCVPLQDFTPSSDIDWTKSIHEIDLQLYKKYGLSKDEINFIETNVKEMN